jgi:SNF2 family DNA or RNA helicase
VIDSKNRDGSYKEFIGSGASVFLVHWEALRLMPDLARKEWLHVIADECHRMKNRKTQQTQALKKIPARYKTAMSGTPVVNRPDEAWSVLNWLDKKQYSSFWAFFKRYVDYEMEYASGGQYQKIKGPKNVEELHAKLGPIMVRRRKEEVLKDLPDKYYTTEHVELSPKQRTAYEQMRKDMIAWVGEQQDRPLVAPVVIAKLVRLQQFAAAYMEDDGSGGWRMGEPSSKLDSLMERVEDSDEPIVVFSQFKQLVNLANERLARAGVPYITITGDVPPGDRGKAVQLFQTGARRIFTGTIGAGGVGITLTAASTVVFLDRGWSPALNLQAEDRLHRIGQTNAVQVIDYVARGTVDLGRMQRLEEKWEWIKALLGDK